MRILLLAEHDNSGLKAEFLKTLSAASQINDQIDVLVIGNQCDEVSRQAARLRHVSRVLLVDDRVYLHSEENISLLVKNMAKDYTHVLCSASLFGKAILPRVAAYLDVAQISNVSAIVSADTFIRPIYAGRLLCKVKSNDPIKVITVMASAFVPVKEEKSADSDSTPVTRLSIKQMQVGNPVMFISEKKICSKRQSLQSAHVVVAAGRGLNSIENFQALEFLADMLGAAIGATRAVVDAGWLSNDQQIGQTAKTVAPELYIALGISGAAQHLAGMKDSKVIIAVNKDPNAPIFQIANYALVADLNEVLPELNTLLKS